MTGDAMSQIGSFVPCVKAAQSFASPFVEAVEAGSGAWLSFKVRVNVFCPHLHLREHCPRGARMCVLMTIKETFVVL